MKEFFPFDPDTLSIESKRAKELGASLAADYQSKTPYHYTSVDNFLPEEVITRVREEALQMGDKPAENMSANENLKTSFNPDRMPKYSKAVFHALNSRPFIQFLEQMSGIKGLIPDPYYGGGGIHRTNTTGYLDIHADFDHHQIMNLERRLNVLIYLNPDWKEEYGGSFEIWTDDMSEKVDSFVPIMNRMCCFSTGANTMHGNPEPVNHPDGEPRLSIALYYYTATWEEGRVAQSTVFKQRPGSNDARSHEATLRVVREFVPPIVYRKTRNLLGRLRRR
ncbi:2OG-Fe(II) oxygenase [Cognatiyoonia sp. IB215446]|uniref:2OG-Fe(II) oxygenase n=1 Tax=Cognatiyoonia sp. IB215446 TaxID=3097355 RepID=UPI002A112492|nr:2OG-Fe(II) oxygenase [Cognatiyoonia sp. IB215446]MDX8349238.1 2OG-Fe(II) oxygenase [Cognatiyoonia sp. IB215446]